MLPVSIAAREAYFSRLEGIRPDLLYSCSSFPVAVAAGLELSPARMPLSVNHRGKTPARDDICPLMELLAGAMETSGAQVVAGMHTCDMTRRFFQESHRFRETSVHQLQLPATSGEEAEAFFSAQVERFCEDMILCGHAKGYSPERAAEWYTGTQKLRDLLEGLAPVTPPVALQYFHHLAGILPPREAHGLIEELSCFHNEYPGEFTLILSGSPVIPGDDTVAETVEKAGGSLIPANCTGLQGFPRGEPRDYTPGSLAALHLRSSRCVRRRPNEPCFEYIGETASGFPPMGYW